MRRPIRGVRRQQNKVTVPIYDPSELSLTGWWKPDYAGSPWTGEEGGTLSQATNAPSTGTAVNGAVPASFDGADDYLDTSTGGTYADLFNNDAGTIIVLVNLTSLDAAEANVFNDAPLFREAGVNQGFHVNADGVAGAIYSGSWKQTATPVAISTGEWAVAAMYWDGVNHGVSVNGGSWTTTACGASEAAGGSANRIGIPFGSSAYLHGDVLEVMTKDAVLTDSNITDIISYFNATYGLSI